ncbi:MAG: prepilin-type N-terminal cleavage/methylation domain-containing protein, partial [Candidatus Peregrinibacteria bacterium]
MKIQFSKSSGFSLVELILAVGISAILLMGMSVFFSSAIKNAFDAQERVNTAQSQFITTAIVQDKFATTKTVLDSAGHKLIALNNTGKMPMSYMGTALDAEGKTHLVFKDWLPFNKVVQRPSDEHNLYG